MHKTCLRHELAMLRLVGSTVARTGEGGAHTDHHARLLREIQRCARCRRKRGEGEPVTLVFTLTCPDQADLGQVVTAFEELLPQQLPDGVGEVHVRVA